MSCFDAGAEERHEPIEAEWAPAGSRLAITCASGIEVVDVPGRRLVGRRPARYAASRFRSDGAALLLMSSRGAEVWDLARGTLAALPGLPVGASPAQLSADFRRAVIPDSAGDLAVVDLASGVTVTTLRGARSLGNTQVSWSPDSTMIATADMAVMLWDAATGKPLHGFPARPLESLDERSLRWAGNGAVALLPLVGRCFDERRGEDPRARRGDRRRERPVRRQCVRGGARWEDAVHERARERVADRSRDPGAARALYRETGDGWHYTFGDLGVSADGRWLTGVMSMMSGMDFEAFDAARGSPAPWR